MFSPTPRQQPLLKSTAFLIDITTGNLQNTNFIFLSLSLSLRSLSLPLSNPPPLFSQFFILYLISLIIQIIDDCPLFDNFQIDYTLTFFWGFLIVLTTYTLIMRGREREKESGRERERETLTKYVSLHVRSKTNVLNISH